MQRWTQEGVLKLRDCRDQTVFWRDPSGVGGWENEGKGVTGGQEQLTER